MKLFRVLVLVVALVAGGVAAYLALSMRPDATAPTVVELAPQIQSQDVLVASADIGQGQKLTPENVRWQRWPDEAMNPTYVQKQTSPDAIDKLKGSIVRSQFIAGEPIREAKLARANSGFLAAILPSGKRAVAVRVSAQNTAGGFILPGDRVDVVKTFSQTTSEGSPGNVSRTILSNVKVLAIDQTVDEAEGEPVVVGKTATLELDPPQVELITSAEADGTLSLALRSFADTAEPAAIPNVAVNSAPGPQQSTSSTIRIFRGARLQELTIGSRRIGTPTAVGPQSSIPASGPDAEKTAAEDDPNTNAAF